MPQQSGVGAEFMKVGEKNGEERQDIGRFLIHMSVDYTHRWLPKVVRDR